MNYKTTDLKVFGLVVDPQATFSEFGINFACEDDKLLNRLTTTEAFDLNPYAVRTPASEAMVVHTQKLIKGMHENSQMDRFPVIAHISVINNGDQLHDDNNNYNAMSGVAHQIMLDRTYEPILGQSANVSFGIGRYFGVRVNSSSENSSDKAIKKLQTYQPKIWETSRFVGVHKGVCFVCMNFCTAYYLQTSIVSNSSVCIFAYYPKISNVSNSRVCNFFLDPRVASFGCNNTPRKHGRYRDISRRRCTSRCH